MRKSLILITLVLFIFTAVNNSSAKELKIGYIDSEKILSQFQDYQDAKRILDQEEQEYSRKAKQMELDIKNLEAEFDANALMWSEEKKMEAQMEGQNLVMRYQQYIEEIWGQTGKLFQRNLELSKPIIDNINLIIQKVGEEEEYDFIFDATAGNIVHAKPDYDITDRIIEELEKK